ncbi:8996_t:CDS:2, partial [Racocetra persica]
PDYKQPRAKCNYCESLCNENIARREGHLKVCEEINPEIKQQYFSSGSSSSQQITPTGPARETPINV